MPAQDASLYFRLRGALIVAVGLLLAGISYAGLVVYQQTDLLQEAVDTTERIIDGNVRVYSQAQRELLRLEFVIGIGGDAEQVELHRQFVAQRVQEGTLSYQVDTLGTPLLLDQARSLANHWRSTVSPVVEVIVRGEDSPQQRDAVLAEIIELELAYNRLVSDSEINRRNVAGAANEATASLLGRSRSLLQVGAATIVILIALGVMLGVASARLDRQRVETSHRLSRLNAELRILSEVAERTNNIVVITDAGGRTTWVNEAFTEVTGYTEDDAVRRTPGELLQGPGTDPETIADMSAHVRAGTGFTREVLNYTRDGLPYWVKVEVHPVHDEVGRLCNFIAVETDITAQRELEQRLRAAKEEAEQIADAKASFLASMSHEIRTPLNAVIGLNSLLLETDLTEEQRGFAMTAESSGRMLLAVINDILSYSAMESGAVELEAQPFHLRALAQDAVELLHHQAEAKGLAVVVDTAAASRPLIGDPARLTQVMVNLIGNAIKFTDRGKITIRADGEPDAEGMMDLRLQVIDTGIGIPTDRMRRLFQPFSQVDASTTRRYGGSGLGLVICRDLIELMGGTISVRSEPGVGTEFTILLSLPLAPTGAVVVDDQPAATAAGQASSLRVLLAEDDPVNQMVATHMLARLGAQDVEVVETGLAAIEAVDQRDFDLVLMDVQMPEMDGPTAVGHIRRRASDRPQPWIVGFTASALLGDRERLIDSGMDSYLAKPVLLDDLAAVIDAVPHRSDEPRGVGSEE